MKGKQMIHKTQVDRKVCLNLPMMQEVLDIFKGLTIKTKSHVSCKKD